MEACSNPRRANSGTSSILMLQHMTESGNSFILFTGLLDGADHPSVSIIIDTAAYQESPSLSTLKSQSAFELVLSFLVD